MKKKVYNINTIPATRATGYAISINPKNGSIMFSKELGDLLVLKGKKVNFIQDEERPTDWYLEPTDDKYAIPIRAKKSGGKNGGFMVQSSYLVRELIKICNLENTGQRIIVANEPVEKTMYPIITKSGKKKS